MGVLLFVYCYLTESGIIDTSNIVMGMDYDTLYFVYHNITVRTLDL